MHAIELGCDRTWRKAQWRTSHGIPIDSPCLGILCDLQSLSLRTHPVEPIVQGLRWMVPKLGLGILSSHYRIPVTFVNLPYQATAIACDPSETLDWICGIDVWLLTSSTPLACAILQVADSLRIPCHKLLEVGNSCEPAISELTHFFELANARLPMLAFRTSAPAADTEMSATVDDALGILASALIQTRPRPSIPSHAIQRESLRRAA